MTVVPIVIVLMKKLHNNIQKFTYRQVNFLCLIFKKPLDFSTEICYNIFVSERNEKQKSEVIKMRKRRRTKNEMIDELEKNGYGIIDSGYESYDYYEEQWKALGYYVKSFYEKTDTKGLKMWVMYGKKKDQT